MDLSPLLLNKVIHEKYIESKLYEICQSVSNLQVRRPPFFPDTWEIFNTFVIFMTIY